MRICAVFFIVAIGVVGASGGAHAGQNAYEQLLAADRLGDDVDSVEYVWRQEMTHSVTGQRFTTAFQDESREIIEGDYLVKSSKTITESNGRDSGIYYRDGYYYMRNYLGEPRNVKYPSEPEHRPSGKEPEGFAMIFFEKGMIASQTATAGRLHFTISPEAVNAWYQRTGQPMEFIKGEVVVELYPDGRVKSRTGTGTFVILAGERMVEDYTASLTFKQYGGVEVTFPPGIENYPEIPAPDEDWDG